ncbi:MAG: ABC-2 transporter permease [Lachnospiraceae bacterium]|nr:ABC-2 transporter permease [Lachnospiraceae bacterium]
MKKYKSLIYYEFRLNRKLNINRVVMFVVSILPFVFMLMALKSEGTELSEMVMQTCMLISAYNIYFLMLGGIDFKKEIDSGWLRYSFVLPFTITERAATIILYDILSTCVVAICNLVCIAGFCAYTDTPFYNGYIVAQFLWITLFMILLIDNHFYIFSARNSDALLKMDSRSRGSGLLVMAMLLLVIIKVSGTDASGLLHYIRPSNLSAGMLIWLIPLLLVLIAVHYAVIYYRLKQYDIERAINRKEKQSDKADIIPLTHSFPKGFLYKEIKQYFKTIITIAIMPILFFVLSIICVAINSSDNMIEGSILSVSTLPEMRVIPAAGVLIMLMVLSVFFQGDDRKLWAYFTASTSGGIKAFLKSKYTFIIALNCLYFVCWCITDVVIMCLHNALSGDKTGFLFDAGITFFFLVLFLTAIAIPFYVRFGVIKGSVIRIIALIAITIVICIIIYIFPDELFGKMVEVIKNMMNNKIAALVSLVTMILSYHISCKLFMKGVEEYNK